MELDLNEVSRVSAPRIFEFTIADLSRLQLAPILERWGIMWWFSLELRYRSFAQVHKIRGCSQSKVYLMGSRTALNAQRFHYECGIIFQTIPDKASIPSHFLVTLKKVKNI